ncbi:MAG: hypothetical protein CSYNP_00024 [Syntrophus sp. SKADARSKE-3]|nr:hypothetical protein [Syntrophus sp. SKADARSKE-3]
MKSPLTKRVFTYAMPFLIVLLFFYLAEFLLGFYLVKSLPRYALPPYAKQRHITADYDVFYRYNNVSIRGMDFLSQATYDVVLLGDSFLFGQGVGEGKTVSAILEGKGVKVLTLSEIATNPIDYFHKLRIVQAHGMKTRRIIVGLCMGNDFQDIADKRVDEALNQAYRPNFLHYGVSDFLSLERLRYQAGKKARELSDEWRCRFFGGDCRERVVVHAFEHRKVFNTDWLGFFTDNRPEMMRAMVGWKERNLAAAIREEDYFQMAQFSEKSLNQTVKILNAVSRISGDATVHVLLIPGPHYVMGFRSAAYDRFVERFKGMLDPAVSIIDLHPLVTPAMHFPRDGHWNEQGHRFIADLLMKRVLSPRE